MDITPILQSLLTSLIHNVKRGISQLKMIGRAGAVMLTKYEQLTVVDPEICPREGGTMTRETCGPAQRASFFSLALTEVEGPGLHPLGSATEVSYGFIFNPNRTGTCKGSC